jgi:hypothetical protein
MNSQPIKPNFNSIHKPPEWIKFAPNKYALAVTVEPFKFSSRQGGVAYELSPKQIKSAGWNAQSGMATALLITIIALFVILVAAGVYAVKNHQIWIAHGITAAMNAVINKSVEEALGRSLS